MEIIILAGGTGSRLQPVVNDVPKCMASVSGHPFLHYLFQYLIPYRPKRVILSLGYKHDIVEKWLLSQELPFEVCAKIETCPLGTGGAIRFALSAALEEDVIVINGDTFFDVNLTDILRFHKTQTADVTLALKPMKDFDRYGTVVLNDNDHKILRFEEKKHCEAGLINGGIYAVKKNILDHFPDKFSMENDYFARKVAEGKLSGFIADTYFIDIGIPEDYQRAQKEFKSRC